MHVDVRTITKGDMKLKGTRKYSVVEGKLLGGSDINTVLT